MNCVQTGCSGSIDADGYCDVCGSAPPKTSSIAQGASDTGARSVDKTQLTRRGVTTQTTSRRPRLGGGLVDIPPVPVLDPATAVMAEPQVPEDRRFCSACDSPVGRSQGETPGRAEGFCRKCGHPFSFTAKLQAGDVVGNQYEVVGCLARGGLGWIYLARDRNVVDRWVVLKGLLNTGDDDARAAALNERRFLAEVEHPNIVKIYNFVEHDDDGYIVMEFVGGTSLLKMLQDRRDANGGAADPLPVGQAIEYMLEILPAMAHLHDLGLRFCDFKPDNVMQTGTALKLIDLGGVYSVDNPTSAIYGTVGYQAPEIAQTGPTVPTDLFTVGRTLAVLCTNFRGYQSTYKFSLPPRDEDPVFAKYGSLYRFLERGTASNPDDRFQSADEMAAQLLGVLREVVSLETGLAHPGLSTVFTGEQRGDRESPDWRVLPALIVSADDPASGFLATVAAGRPEDMIDALRAAPEQTAEVDLRIARAYIEDGRSIEANETLDALEKRDPWEWRARWYRGVDRLQQGDAAAASACFDAVYREVPGELAPKLALAFSAEHAGDFQSAQHFYDIVSATDPTLTSASFGLARCRIVHGDVPGALDAFERVPERSSAYTDAQVAKVETMMTVPVASNGSDSTPVDITQIRAAAGVLNALALTGERRARLDAAVFEAAINALRAASSADPSTDDVSILGRPLTERAMRLGLESTYRALARYAPTTSERIRLVDMANHVRPRTLT